MKSHRIEDLKVWSKSMAWVKEVYLVASELPDEEKFGLVSQMRRCAVSIHQILQKEQEEIIKMNFTSFLELRLDQLMNCRHSYNC